jgi:hypothetical protein
MERQGDVGAAAGQFGGDSRADALATGDERDAVG